MRAKYIGDTMRNTGATNKKRMKRINLTLSSNLYKRFEEEIKAKNMHKVEAIRIAISSWLDSQISQKMADGYAELAEENLNMLNEFETIDNENWL